MDVIHIIRYSPKNHNDWMKKNSDYEIYWDEMLVNTCV
jgi:hypothetical protein